MSSAIPKPNSNQTAILAEDDRMVRELVSAYLEELGYHVLQANDGQRAIELIDARDEPLDLIVTDFVMPKANGAAVIESARESGKCDNILVISGFAEEFEVIQASLQGDSEFLSKPFTFTDFKQKIFKLKQGSS